MNPIEARASLAAPETAVDEFMFMPAGVQSIQAFQAGKPISLSVLVDKSSAEAIQAQFAALSKRSSHKPYFDFDHDDKSASFWPDSFAWREGLGIFCRGQWSAAGQQAVEGKVYRSFSPVFHVDNPRKSPARIVTNAAANLNMGGLVNNPAFKNNLPLWAKDAGQPSSATKTKTQTMQKTKAELEAEIQQINADLTELKGRAATPEIQEAIAGKNADLELLEAQLEAAQARDESAKASAELSAIRAAEAQKAVADAIARGVFGPKDDMMIGHWTREITEKPASAAILAKMPGRVVLGSKPRAGIETSDSGAIIGRVQIVRADIKNVFTNLCSIQARQSSNSGVDYRNRAALSHELAAIYGKEIKPRMQLDRKPGVGDDIYLRDLTSIAGVASNTLGTLAQTLVAIRALELLTQELPMIKAVTTDFSDMVVSYGDVVNTRIRNIPTATAYNTGTGFPTPNNTTTTDVALTFNQWYGVYIQFLGHEMAGTLRNLFDEQAQGQAYALGDQMVDGVLALITSANFTNTPESSGLGTFARRNVINMGTALRKRGVAAGPANRTLFLNSDYFGQLATDSALVQLAANSGQDRSIITEGILPNVHGFKVIDTPTLPATALTAGTLAGFAFAKSALVLATRLSSDYTKFAPGVAHGNLTVVSTPAGFSANLVQFVEHAAVTANSRLDAIWAHSKGQGDAGHILAQP